MTNFSCVNNICIEMLQPFENLIEKYTVKLQCVNEKQNEVRDNKMLDK